MNTRTNPTTTRRRRLSASIALLAVSASLAACGSDSKEAASTEPRDSVEATTADTATDDTSTDDTATDTSTDTSTEDTATEGTATVVTTEDTASGDTVDPAGSMDSEFCRTAAEAESLGDQVEPAYSGTPEELQAAVEAALEANSATLAVAPPEIADVMARATDFQERFADILRTYGWDFEAATGSAEAEELLQGQGAAQADLDEVRAYLEETCGIEDDSDDASSTGATLPEGDEGLRRFIQLYAIGSGNEVTPEQEDCFVGELSGKVEVSQLESMLDGAQDEDTQIAVGLAALSCGIVTASGAAVTTTTG